MIDVFGSTGFIGSNFTRLYSQESIKIPREIRSSTSDEIVYFISTTHNYHVYEDPTLDVKTNLLVLTETLDRLRMTKNKSTCFNFISSWFVYGDTTLPAREDAPCNPKGFYSITKHCAEKLVESFCKTHDIQYRILRLCNVYGPGDTGSSKKKNALDFLIQKMKSNEPISLYHGGEFFRDYMHVNDVCEAIYTVLKSDIKNEIVNIGTGKKQKFKELIDLASDFTNYRGKINFIDPPDFHKLVQVKDMYLDVKKLKGVGFSPKISIEEGIRELCLK